MNEQSMRFRIGIFVLSAMILFAILIMLFGRTPTFFKTQDTYTIVFPQAAGVTPGTPVRRSGVRIGQVQAVELNDETGAVRVTIAIDRPHQLFEDDTPVLVHGALSGDTSIDFVPRSAPPREPPAVVPQKKTAEIIPAGLQLAQGPPVVPVPPPQPPHRVPVKPGTEFTGSAQSDVAGLIRELSKVTPPATDAFVEARRTLERYQQLTPLMEETMREFRDLAKTARETVPELKKTNDEVLVAARNWARVGERVDVLIQTNQDKLVKTLDNLNDTIVRVANVFNEENQKNLATTLRNVGEGSKNLESISNNTNELLKESRQTIKRVNDSVTQADQVLTNLQQTTKPMAERSASVMQNLDEGTLRFNRTMADLQESLRAFNTSDGTLRRFLADPALYNNLNEAACLLTRIMPRLDRILKDVEVFADKIARHPESLGVGGAISPSAGLKESPTRSMSFRPGSH